MMLAAFSQDDRCFLSSIAHGHGLSPVAKQWGYNGGWDPLSDPVTFSCCSFLFGL